MSTGPARTLKEFRNRTDRELVVLLRSEIEKSQTSSSAEAEDRYARARTLLAIARMSSKERAELEALLHALRESLNRRSWSCSAA